MYSLKNKSAIITGASSGIGLAAAKLFAKSGAQLIISGRRADLLHDLVSAIDSEGGVAIAVAGDVTDPDHAQACVDMAMDRFGRLDIAFNNAGSTGAMAPAADLSIEDWQETINTNLTSAFMAAKAQIPAMTSTGGGSLIFTSSFVGHTVGFPGMAAYGAAKAGVNGLVQILAAELGQSNIRVNALLPGGTDTPSNVANAPGAAPETRGFVEGLHALKRMAAPEEIASAALYLASNASSFMTGTAMLVDGGVSIYRT